MNTYDAEDSGLHNTPESDCSMTLEGVHCGNCGDFAWHTTPHWELPESWASPSTMRKITGWDSYPSVGENVCVYSRMQGRRDCSQVYAISVSATVSGQPTKRNLVAVDDDLTVGGDSGGPWSIQLNKNWGHSIAGAIQHPTSESLVAPKAI